MSEYTYSERKRCRDACGGACPKCGGQAEGGSLDFEGNQIHQAMVCTECNEEWTNVYELVSVRPSDP